MASECKVSKQMGAPHNWVPNEKEKTAYPFNLSKGSEHGNQRETLATLTENADIYMLIVKRHLPGFKIKTRKNDSLQIEFIARLKLEKEYSA